MPGWNAAITPRCELCGSTIDERGHSQLMCDAQLKFNRGASKIAYCWVPTILLFISVGASGWTILALVLLLFLALFCLSIYVGPEFFSDIDLNEYQQNRYNECNVNWRRDGF